MKNQITSIILKNAIASATTMLNGTQIDRGNVNR